jgi:hypothetical protein
MYAVAMRKNWIVCGLFSLIISGCVHRKNVEATNVKAPPAPSPRANIQVNEIAGLATRPAHVAKVVKVLERGKPVATLRKGAFRIQEDGQPLDNENVDFRLLPPEDAIAFHSVLLMDLSPATTKEGRAILAESATRFVRAIQPRQSVTVLAFDGSPKLRVIGDFPRNPRAGGASVAEARFVAPTDPSRNLRGAVVEGLNRLDARLRQYGRSVYVGNFVVFSAGPDLANRVAEAAMVERLKQSRDNIYFVGMQKDVNGDASQTLSRSGKELRAELSQLPEAFEGITRLVSSDMNSHYVLSYCTPARSGKRTVRVEVDVVDDDLKIETGVVESQFEAAGFSTGCNAAKPPRLSAIKPAATK